MGMFDYKDYSGADAVELITLTHRLAAYSNIASVATIPVDGLLETSTRIIPDGAVLGGRVDRGLPDGWRAISPDELGLPADSVNVDGHYTVTSPLTGDLPTGPEVDLFGEYDDNGQLSRIAVSWVGTNSPVDVADYLQLNAGTIASQMEPFLSAVASFAQGNGLSGDDVLVTGYSLGGGYTNVMARFNDSLADGFFADSDYVGHAAPVIYDEGGEVINVGSENDIVHRAAGNQPTLEDAVAPTLPLLEGQDYDLASSTDNVILFDDAYASGSTYIPAFSLTNPASWAAHVEGLVSDATTRIGTSAFYDLTHRDSVVIVSNLGALSRQSVWVEDKDTPVSSHAGASAFLIGTEFDDKIRDGVSNDFIDTMGGDDVIRLSTGFDAVDGGAGHDEVWLDGNASDWTAYRLGSGELFLESAESGLKQLTDVEEITILGAGQAARHYAVETSHLEDTTYDPIPFSRFFGQSDQDIRYTSAVEGTDADDTLSGSAVFGGRGDDTLSGTDGDDLLVGGYGHDVLAGGMGDDRLYGAADDDVLIFTAGNDTLNGGHGDDRFVFAADASGTAIVEDFNKAYGETDSLVFDPSIFADEDAVLAASHEEGNDTVIDAGDFTVRLLGTSTSDLHAGDFLFA
ncbi:calcium-binding protein [Salinicola endophyticus]|uniref:Calcium-binding protein n=1 Tax=Salinicola endophyticus TaxID=1949083 RepID=A0AB74UDB7_9GAMM